MSRPRYDFQEQFGRSKRARSGFNGTKASADSKPSVRFGGHGTRRPGKAPDGNPESDEPEDDPSMDSNGTADEARSERSGREESSSQDRDEPRIRFDAELTDYHFMILGLRRETATPAMIREAYRRAVLSNHPDKNRDDPFALDRFKAIQEVYDLLQRKVRD
jgi:hypothetical protein